MPWLATCCRVVFSHFDIYIYIANYSVEFFQFREDDFVPRTPASHDYHCSLLSGPLREADSVTYGVNYESALNSLEHFHLADNRLPQDVMHILLEGVIPYTIKCTLRRFICENNYFTIDFLNERITCFPFSRSESRSKPTRLSSDSILHGDGGLRQTGSYIICMYTYHRNDYFLASQIWHLAIYLPLISGDKVPENNKEWECFILLLEILRICMSRVISPNLVDYLRELISIYLITFSECYPTMNIIPKQHYMIHFPSQILKYVYLY